MNVPVVIAAFRSADEARAAVEALLARGIDARSGHRFANLERRCADVFDDGFDVVVDDSDADEALRLLHELWPEEARDAAASERCPACGSGDVLRIPRLAIFAGCAALLLGASIVFGQHELFLLAIGIVALALVVTPNSACRSCGERWRRRHVPMAEDAVEPDDLTCPRCGSPRVAEIDHRKEKAATLILNLILPPMLLLWPFQTRHRCGLCGHEWR